VSGYYQPAHDIVAGSDHTARAKWMAANDVTGMSVSPAGETTLTYAGGREVSGMACDLLPVRLRPR
jgi:hypothetical protein